jgi:hypothetical protein
LGLLLSLLDDLIKTGRNFVSGQLELMFGLSRKIPLSWRTTEAS